MLLSNIYHPILILYIDIFIYIKMSIGENKLLAGSNPNFFIETKIWRISKSKYNFFRKKCRVWNNYKTTIQYKNHIRSY